MSPDSIHPTPEELFAYRDGELAADRRVLVEAHVVGCHACRERVDRVSQLEAELRQKPDQVGGDYYAQLSRSVLGRIGAAADAPAAAVPAPQPSEPAAAAGARRPEGSGERGPEEPVRRERRRADLPAEARRSRAPGFPWPALISTVAAAAAVVVVVVMLFQKGVVRRAEHGLVTLRAPAESAAPAPPTQAPPTTAGQTPAEPSPGGVAETRAAREPGTETPLEQAPPAGNGEPSRAAETRELAKASQQVAGRADQAVRVEPRAKGVAPSAEGAPEAGRVATSAPGTPEAGRVATSAGAAPGAVGESPFRSILRRRGLPPLWEQGRVSPQALRVAEPELRTLYQTGRAGADSASVRLYLAEAARLAYEASPDSSLYGRIVHHYLRAIRLAGPDSDIGRVARERLRSFSR